MDGSVAMILVGVWIWVMSDLARNCWNERHWQRTKQVRMEITEIRINGQPVVPFTKEELQFKPVVPSLISDEELERYMESLPTVLWPGHPMLFEGSVRSYTLCPECRCSPCIQEEGCVDEWRIP